MKRTGREFKQFVPQLVETVAGFLLRLSRESERSAVVLGVARLDHALEQALKALLRVPPGDKDELFESDRALGNLSVKIEIGHRLGLLSDDAKSVLHAFRRIRNAFAHSIHDETLSLAPHRDRLAHIVSVMHKTHMWSQFSTDFMDDIPSPDVRAFVKALTVLVAALDVAAWANEPLQPEITTAIVFEFDDNERAQ